MSAPTRHDVARAAWALITASTEGEDFAVIAPLVEEMRAEDCLPALVWMLAGQAAGLVGAAATGTGMTRAELLATVGAVVSDESDTTRVPSRPVLPAPLTPGGLIAPAAPDGDCDQRVVELLARYVADPDRLTDELVWLARAGHLLDVTARLVQLVEHITAGRSGATP